MKTPGITAILMVFATPLSGRSRLQSGSHVPDFALTAINGVQHALYAYLDTRKTMPFTDWFESTRTSFPIVHTQRREGISTPKSCLNFLRFEVSVINPFIKQ